LVDLTGPESFSKTQEVVVVDGKTVSRAISERLHVLDTAKAYSKVKFSIVLFMTPFVSEVDPQATRPAQLQIQSRDLEIQVSDRYEYNPNSDFLLLTSWGTKPEVFDAWKDFTHDSLHTTADVWNVSQRGGLIKAETGTAILLDYPTKAIIALNDSFPFADRGKRNVIDFVDAVEVPALALKNSSFAFFQPPNDPRASTMFSRLTEIAYSRLIDPPDVSYHCVGFEELAIQIKGQRGIRSGYDKSPKRYSISYPETFTSILPGNSRLDKRGKRLARKLRKKFPLDRFIITEKEGSSGLDVLQCLNQGHNVSSVQVKYTTHRDSESAEFINAASVYFLVSSLPLPRRLDILYSIDTGSGPAYPETVQTAACMSVMHELQECIDDLTRRPRWHHSIFSFKPDKLVTSPTLGDKLSMVLQHRLMSRHGGIQPNSIAYEILSSLILSARCQTILQLLKKLFSPFQRTRSHVKRLLLQRAQEALGAGMAATSVEYKIRVKAFKKRVRQRVINKSRMVEIEAKIGEVTNGEIRHVRENSTSIDDVFKKSIFLSRNEVERHKAAYSKIKRQQHEDYGHVQQSQKELGLTRTGVSPFGDENGIQEVHAISAAAAATRDIWDGLGDLHLLELGEAPRIQTPILVPQRIQEPFQHTLLPDEPLIEFEPDEDLAELHGRHLREMDGGGRSSELHAQPIMAMEQVSEMEAENPLRVELAAREVAALEIGTFLSDTNSDDDVFEEAREEHD
jgi:hypothetical protein